MSFEPDSLRDEGPVPLKRGTNQAGMREQNERLVLSLVRSHGPLAKSEIARITGLSAQTVSVIMRHLESDRLIRRGEPQRGRVGQPLVPLSLDPEGAFFLGAKVGRRSLEVVLVDFVGGIRHRAAASYPFPTPARHDPPDPGRGRHLRGAARRGRRPHRRPRHRDAVRALGLGRGDRRAGGRARGLAPRPTCAPSSPPADALAGLPAERRHRRLRRRARLRPQRRAAGTSSTSTSAPSSAAAWC